MLRILPRSQGNVIGFEFNGTITAKDYDEILIPAFERIIAEHGKVRALVEFTDAFTGFALKAVAKDLRYSSRHLHQFEKFAVVNAPVWITIMTRLTNALTKCQCRSFSKSERKAAWDFIEK